MSRRPAIEHQTLGDLLALDQVEVRCHGCGRRVQRETGPLLTRLRTCDWATPLHDAARKLRCEQCGERLAQIVVPRQQPRLRLVPKEEPKREYPWQRFDAHMKAMRGG